MNEFEMELRYSQFNIEEPIQLETKPIEIDRIKEEILK